MLYIHFPKDQHYLLDHILMQCDSLDLMLSISAVLSVLDFFPVGKLKNVTFWKYSRSDEFTGVA